MSGTGVVRAALIGAIRAYQLALSPWLGRGCRYLPTCSAYAIEAIERHGAVRGTWLAARRLGRCHPWGGSGYDPVPGSGEPGESGQTVNRRAGPKRQESCREL